MREPQPLARALHLELAHVAALAFAIIAEALERMEITQVVPFPSRSGEPLNATPKSK